MVAPAMLSQDNKSKVKDSRRKWNQAGFIRRRKSRKTNARSVPLSTLNGVMRNFTMHFDPALL